MTGTFTGPNAFVPNHVSSGGRARMWQVTLVALAMYMSLTGCSRPKVIIPEFGSVGRESLGALVQGPLVVDGSCLYVDGESGTVWLPVFPEGTVSWNGDRLVIHSAPTMPPGVGEVRPGEEIAFGGGEITGGKFRSLPFTQEPHWGCDTGHVWMVGQVAG